MNFRRLIDPHIHGTLTLVVDRASLGVPRAGDALLTNNGPFAFSILLVELRGEVGPMDVYAVTCMAVSVASLSKVRTRWHC